MKRITIFLTLLFILSFNSLAQQYVAGDYVDDFTLPDSGGSPVSLSDFSDNIVCIYFWAST